MANAADPEAVIPARRFSAFSLAMLLTFALLNVAALLLLPHDKYLRYQALNDGQAPTTYWIYERIHFDPAPIDIAFLGTSRTGMSIHSARLEQDLSRFGIHAKAVNFYCVRNGINLQYVIAKELLDSRKVKLLVLEITEAEERKGHDAFNLYADSSDILSAPLLINLGYLSDIARLPGRQVSLAWETLLQRFGLRDPEFVPPPYEGPNRDHAEFIRSIDNAVHFNTLSHTEAEMDNQHAEWDRGLTRPVLPGPFSSLEFRLPRYYENRILELARAHGTQVVFLYMPKYGGPATPLPYQQYASRADLINPYAVGQDYRLWLNENHANWEGAKRVTDYVAEALGKRPELR
jgi:hypothetical protein